MGQLQVLAPAIGIWAAMATAEGWEQDVWHFVTEDSPFHEIARTELPSAGILQGNGRFALLVLGSTEEGALVSVNLAMSEPASELTSTLVMPDGTILVRNVAETGMDAVSTQDGTSVTYSFGIAPIDIEQFMAAELWRVQAGERLTTISLVGSRNAISAAIEQRDAGGKEPVVLD